MLQHPSHFFLHNRKQNPVQCSLSVYYQTSQCCLWLTSPTEKLFLAALPCTHSAILLFLMGLLFSCSLWMSQHPCAHFFHVWTGAKAGSGAALSQGLPFLLLQPDSFRCHNPMFVKHCHGSELNVTDTASWSESGRRIKRGQLLFIDRHYRNQQRWEHTWKALTRYLIHHLGVFSSGYLEQQESSPPAHQTPHAALFQGVCEKVKKQLTQIHTKATERDWAAQIEAGGGSKREVSCWTPGCLVSCSWLW